MLVTDVSDGLLVQFEAREFRAVASRSPALRPDSPFFCRTFGIVALPVRPKGVEREGHVL